MIDAHCHIDLYRSPYMVAKEIESEGIPTIAVTNLPSHFELGFAHLKKFRHVRVALGLHPLYVKEHTPSELKKFVGLVHKTSYIGEVGLDFSREGIATKAKQIDSFRHVLTHISERPRFISLHSRRAESTVLEMLDEFSIKGAIFHWYSGSLSVLKEIVAAGHYFSVNPAMLLSTNGCKIIEKIPRDRLLTETDGPFIKIRDKVITTQDISLVQKYLCSVWNCSYEDVERQINKNFNQILLPIKNHKRGSY
ncbi:Qat anti-phage system TatD family nuclease QatD [Cohnella caldifontis]|uniref:Qat anti-phage system TatD family nuclease QatD n=1 Tax=Cohnella caldifontis TaxID=3027471 RepID=UPI0023EAB51F|nr:Qat anti-phage system TatD family nuclease QatD [Cohnella sp. YIM B05605]